MPTSNLKIEPSRSLRWFTLRSLASAALVTLILGGAVVLRSAIAVADDPPDESPIPAKDDSAKSKALMATMKRLAGRLTVREFGDEPTTAELIPEALFRSHDPAREILDGTIWGYGKKGRPVAILSLAFYADTPNRPGQWVYEFDSLATTRVDAKVPRGVTWSSRRPGLEFKAFPDAPAPHAKEAGRTRQFRDLSSRFTAYELLSSAPKEPAERFELRLLPRPIYRYSDPERGQIDGAIFLLTSTTNPEIVMVIELAREGEKSMWKYAFNRIAWAELHVELDGREVWTQPPFYLSSPPSYQDPYWLFSTPLAPGDLEP